MFAEQYLRSLTTCDLRDDDQHRQTEALAAAAMADMTGGSGSVFGSLLTRAKYGDGISHKIFESGNRNLATLLRAWTKLVTQKGHDRQWMKIKAKWDIKAANGRYAKIALMSLAHWLKGECEKCKGTKIAHSCACTHCGGTGKEPVKGGAWEVERTKDMISELEGLYQAHSARASVRLRRSA